MRHETVTAGGADLGMVVPGDPGFYDPQDFHADDGQTPPAQLYALLIGEKNATALAVHGTPAELRAFLHRAEAFVIYAESHAAEHAAGR